MSERARLGERRLLRRVRQAHRQEVPVRPVPHGRQAPRRRAWPADGFGRHVPTMRRAELRPALPRLRLPLLGPPPLRPPGRPGLLLLARPGRPLPPIHLAPRPIPTPGATPLCAAFPRLRAASALGALPVIWAVLLRPALGLRTAALALRSHRALLFSRNVRFSRTVLFSGAVPVLGVVVLVLRSLRVPGDVRSNRTLRFCGAVCALGAISALGAVLDVRAHPAPRIALLLGPVPLHGAVLFVGVVPVFFGVVPVPGAVLFFRPALAFRAFPAPRSVRSNRTVPFPRVVSRSWAIRFFGAVSLPGVVLSSGSAVPSWTAGIAVPARHPTRPASARPAGIVVPSPHPTRAAVVGLASAATRTTARVALTGQNVGPTPGPGSARSPGPAQGPGPTRACRRVAGLGSGHACGTGRGSGCAQACGPDLWRRPVHAYGPAPCPGPACAC
jgi:hypothetical protein